MKYTEEWAYVLDYLPNGRPEKKIFKPIAQVVGEKYFILLEVIPKENVNLEIGERVYIGREFRPKIYRILRKINYDDLTPEAQKELEIILEDIIKKREKEFVDFFNNASLITPRLHSLELLPKIGKTKVTQIVREREIKPFESFKDIEERVEIKNIPKIIAERIIKELKGEDKYKLFTI